MNTLQKPSEELEIEEQERELLADYWEKHPGQRAVFDIVASGKWVTQGFGWLYMMISRLAGPVMTIAVGFLIYYAIEFHHGLSAVKNPGMLDNLASLANGIINVGPELVFPGLCVLAVKAFGSRRWVDGALYTLSSALFATLTMVLLIAFINNQLTDGFVSSMLAWRTAGALFFTVVSEFCGHAGQVNVRKLMQSLNSLREEAQSLRSTVHALTHDRDSIYANYQRSKEDRESLQSTLDSLRVDYERSTQEVYSLQTELATVRAEKNALDAQLARAGEEIDGLRAQLDAASQREQRVSGQVDEYRALVARSTQEVDGLRKEVYGLRSTVEEIDGLRSTVYALTQERDGLRVDYERSTQEIDGLRDRIGTLVTEVDEYRAMIETRPASKQIARRSSSRDRAGQQEDYIAHDNGRELAIADGQGNTTIATGSFREQIKAVMLEMVRAGEPLTWPEVARRANAGLSTVKKHGPSIRQELQLDELRDTGEMDAIEG